LFVVTLLSGTEERGALFKRSLYEMNDSRLDAAFPAERPVGEGAREVEIEEAFGDAGRGCTDTDDED